MCDYADRLYSFLARYDFEEFFEVQLSDLGTATVIVVVRRDQVADKLAKCSGCCSIIKRLNGGVAKASDLLSGECHVCVPLNVCTPSRFFYVSGDGVRNCTRSARRAFECLPDLRRDSA